MKTLRRGMRSHRICFILDTPMQVSGSGIKKPASGPRMATANELIVSCFDRQLSGYQQTDG